LIIFLYDSGHFVLMVAMDVVFEVGFHCWWNITTTLFILMKYHIGCWINYISINDSCLRPALMVGVTYWPERLLSLILSHRNILKLVWLPFSSWLLPHIYTHNLSWYVFFLLLFVNLSSISLLLALIRIVHIIYLNLDIIVHPEVT
jgi:hypothetical protein